MEHSQTPRHAARGMDEAPLRYSRKDRAAKRYNSGGSSPIQSRVVQGSAISPRHGLGMDGTVAKLEHERLVYRDAYLAAEHARTRAGPGVGGRFSQSGFAIRGREGRREGRRQISKFPALTRDAGQVRRSDEV